MPISEDFYIALDTETGGLQPGYHEVIEVAMILLDLQFKEIDRLETKIKPCYPDRVTKEAAAINGYTVEKWADAPEIGVVKSFLRKRIPRGSVAVPIGHNVGYDRAMLYDGYWKPFGEFFPLSYHLIDTVTIAGLLKLAGVVQVPNLKLTSMTKALGITHSDAHTAMSDCLASLELFKRAIRAFGLPTVKDDILKAPKVL